MQRVLRVLFSCGAVVGVGGQGYRRAEHRRERLVSPRMHEVLTLAALPPALDWRNVGGQTYTTVSRNQHIPKYCGACYTFGSVSALGDRIRIARGATAGREINLAVQVVLNCDTVDWGCSGGDGLSVYDFIYQVGGIPEETCQPYMAVGHDTGTSCKAENICQTCNEDGCTPQEEYEVFGIEEFGGVAGEFEMMAELQRGPLACSISTPDTFLNHVGWGIYEDLTNDSSVDHIISVVGYGTEAGKDYWVLRNSWGTYWGHYGWARIARGKNNIQIEADCIWAVPSNGGLPKVRRVGNASATQGGQAPPAKPSMSQVDAAAAADEGLTAHMPCRAQRSNWTAAGGERVLGPRPQDELRADDMPRTWDWRNISGASFVTWNTNERAPHGDCASCWAHAVTSALADRLAVQNGGRWPQVGLSPQMLINCRGGGSCAGGDPAGAYAHIHRHGITDETCQNYQAQELECNSAGICMNCAPGGEHGLVWPGTCVGVKDPIMWYVSQYGAVRGAQNMKAEIYKRGPIGCGLEATEGFRKYAGGIYSEALPGEPLLNQQVSLAGWGAAGDLEFWYGRNSWGTYWGEGGWFRVLMHRNNLGVELDCDWGVPELSRHPPPTVLVDSRAGIQEEPSDPGIQSRALLAVALLASTAAALAGLFWHLAARRHAAEDPAPYILVA